MHSNWRIDNFRDALTFSVLFDLGFVQPIFTWKGKRKRDDYIRARLDRCLAFISFSQSFSSCYVFNISVVIQTTLL